jgi:hypothetical protein
LGGQVFVMEESQRRYLRTHFPDALKDKKIVCLRVLDVYGFMQPELIAVLRAKVMPLLRQSNELNYLSKSDPNVRYVFDENSLLLQEDCFWVPADFGCGVVCAGDAAESDA